MRISDVDVETRVDDLILSQYKSSTHLKEYIKAFVKPVQPLFHTLDAHNF